VFLVEFDQNVHILYVVQSIFFEKTIIFAEN
jgi:hypothetical protein